MFSPDQLKALQRALHALKLYDGNIDGIVGSQTLLAVEKFAALYAPANPILPPPDPEPTTASPITTEQDGEGASIDQALIFTLKNEGGFSHHPNDRGGATNRGITAATLARFLGKPSVSVQEVKDLDYATTTQIYKRFYWDVMNLDQVFDQGIATALFDMGVLCGTGTATRLCQEVLGITPISTAMHQQVIDALNASTDDVFIPAFAARHRQRFEQIVKNNPSQQVFLKGWLNRANRLLSLVSSDVAPDPTTSIPTPPDRLQQAQTQLHRLAQSVNLPTADIDRMIADQAQHATGRVPRYWAVFRIRQHSKQPRLFVLDWIEQQVTAYYATHGKNSDPNHDGLATEFSNQVGSLKSALGLYRTAETYQMAKHGRALRLDGLEASNSNARQRGIVLHGVPYANAAYVQKNGKCGRSNGCPAVDEAIAQALIDQLKGGSLLLIV
jgi:lysozyme family protein